MNIDEITNLRNAKIALFDDSVADLDALNELDKALICLNEMIVDAKLHDPIKQPGNM